MSTDRDTTRIVRSWLRTDEHESADRVLDNVLALLDATQQRRSRWPTRRIADMNTIAKLGIVAAAVVVIAVVGMNLLPARGGVGGGPEVSPSPLPSAPLSPSPAPAEAFPTAGPVAIGTHRAVLDGVPFSFSVPSSGWATEEVGTTIIKGEGRQPDGVWLSFKFSAPDNVYADPCAHTPLSPPPSATAPGLAAAVAAIPGTDLVSGPSSIDVGGRLAQHVVLMIREDLGCDPNDAYLWYDESSGGTRGGWWYAGALGSTIRVWIVDVDGKLVWIEGQTFKGAGPEQGQQIQQIVDSIQFE